MDGPAIVIFGAAVRRDGTPSDVLRRRVEAAFACGRTLPGTLYVPTGGIGRHGPAEADVMADLLAAHGVSGGAILRERSGTDTLSSARAVARLLRGRRAPVLVATSRYHLLRCVLLLRLAGLPAQPCPVRVAAPAQPFGTRWHWRLREAAALPFDTALLLALKLLRRA